ncbi:MAG: hypothetical protein LUE16_02610 [Lachnospiraceae bacterium]|nr:hypothetical protein [Lachnospiraceae bacterium]
MSAYEVGRMISLLITLLSGMAAIFLFFFLDIRGVLRASSRKGRRKRIKQKQERYQSRDSSSDLGEHAASRPQYITPSGETKGGTSQGSPSRAASPPGANATPRQVSPQNRGTAPSEMAVTSVLRQGDAGNMTTVLHESGRQNPTIAPNRRFEIIQNILVVHTDEKI